MKIILLITFIFISFKSFALSDKEISKMIVSMADFAEKEKLSDKDLPELTQQLKNILILEKVEESHQGPFELALSYPKNKALYQKAIKSFKKDEQKVLQNILKIVEDISKNGNG